MPVFLGEWLTPESMDCRISSLTAGDQGEIIAPPFISPQKRVLARFERRDCRVLYRTGLGT